MTTLTGRLVTRHHPAARWYLAACHIEAQQIPWAGQALTVTVTHAPGDLTGEAILCTARSGSQTITTMTMDIEVLHDAS
ncbi:hypothetical protein FCH28_07240 [Streptomyces piniterrae]|uniref:Uncharacterized protein n=1 Tax=Streptomyces piniterrae TaxID=2571125 RepID=A0A4U0NRM2_9ACTN|nr:hypothetical protein [Streptomyces piniterrae]TJZ57226.1 hypothetical protein FCH28_07240 [Streptomyces piniterrae]